MAERLKKYQDPVACPICKKVFAEWAEVKGKAVIKKWCPKCKKHVFITKQG